MTVRLENFKFLMLLARLNQSEEPLPITFLLQIMLYVSVSLVFVMQLQDLLSWKYFKCMMLASHY